LPQDSFQLLRIPFHRQGKYYEASLVKGELIMPIYDFICLDCENHFALHTAVKDYEKQQKEHEIKCPKCESKNVEHEIEPFFAVTSKKS
jgi:putative FmdB family regulatory protein